MADEDLEVAVEADDAPNDDEMVREITGNWNEFIVKQDILSNCVLYLHYLLVI